MTTAIDSMITTPIPTKASGSHFYRYGEFTEEKQSWLKEIMLEHRLYIPTVTQLNDPGDGRPRLALQSEDEFYFFIYNGPYGVLARNPSMKVEEQVEAAVRLELTMIKHGVQTLQREMAKCLNARFERWRVYSLSKRYDNLNLWAKYAAGHTGYCLEFANQGHFFNCAMEVIYGQSVQMDVNNPAHLNGYWFVCKNPDWSNEEEVRILVPPSGDTHVQIDPYCLTRIILGWKMSNANRQQIREWANQREPQVAVVDAYYDELDQAIKVTQS